MSEQNWQEVKASIVSWGKVGDVIEGTLTDVSIREVQDQVKGLVKKKVYEIRADSGQYHETDDKKNPIEPPVICNSGDYFKVWGGKDVIDDPMRKAKLGQKVKMIFAEEGEPKKKGYSGFKLIKTYLGAMDDEWLNAQEVAAKDFGEM